MQVLFNTFGISNLGAFAWLVGQITNALGAFANLLFTLVQNMFAGLFFAIATQLLKMIDFVQSLFSKLIGLEPYWYNGGMVGNPDGGFGTDPATLLLSEPIVLEALTAMLIVAVVVLILLSIVQVVRMEYTADMGKDAITKGKVFGQMLKSLALFVTVPVAVFFGITASNYLLRSVAGALDLSGAGGSVSASLFKASATEANWANNFNVSSGDPIDDFFGSLSFSGKSNFSIEDGKVVVRYNGQIIEQFSSNAQDIEQQQREVAQKIDNAFATGAVIPGIGELSIKDSVQVNSFYDLAGINYLILYIAGVVILYFLFLAAFGLVVRLYKIVAYFIISPPMIALSVVNPGAYTNWRTAFVGQVLSAYGTVAGLNLFLITVPLIQNIELFDPSKYGHAILNSYVHLIMIIAGCFLIKDLIDKISSWIGAGNALTEGTNVANKAMSAATTVALGAGVGGAVLTKGLGMGAAKATGLSKFTAAGQAKRSEKKGIKADNLDKEIAKIHSKGPLTEEDQKLVKGLETKRDRQRTDSAKLKQSSEDKIAKKAAPATGLGKVYRPMVRGLAAMTSLNAVKSVTGSISEMVSKPAKSVLGFDGVKDMRKRYGDYKKKDQTKQASIAADKQAEQEKQQKIVENATKAAQIQEKGKVDTMVVNKLQTSKDGKDYDSHKGLVNALVEAMEAANHDQATKIAGQLREIVPTMDRGFRDFASEASKMAIAFKEGNKSGDAFTQAEKNALIDGFNNAKANSVVNSEVIINAVRDKAVDELSADLKTDLQRIERQVKEEIKKSTKKDGGK